MRLLFFTLLLLPFLAVSQSKFEVREFTGTVKSIEPGFRYAIARMKLEVKGEPEFFIFPPTYGKMITERFLPGETITLKANVNLTIRGNRNKWLTKEKDIPFFLYRDEILAIKVEGGWLDIVKPSDIKSKVESEVHINQTVLSTIQEDGYNKGIVFENGMVAYNPVAGRNYDPMKKIKEGDKISFLGQTFPREDGYVYPIDRVKKVFNYYGLMEGRGRLYSLLFKQNHVCIGARFKTKKGTFIDVSFPSFHAEEVQRFLNPEEEVKLYHGEIIGSRMDLPELHAIIQGSDTLKILEFGFFGGADGKHEHKDVDVSGKITHVERTAKGNIASIIVKGEYYVEIDAMMAQQIGYVFRKGLIISIIGKQRIRIPGEIYKKEYKIVVPQKVVMDGKTFSLFEP